MTARLYTRPIRLPILPALVFVALTAPAGASYAWTGTLERGGEIRVDPRTHRATRVDGDSSRPLWDGVHRLEDGSVVIVHDGTAVPTEQMLQSWEEGVQAAQALEGRPCERLERRVCGRDNACRATAACLNARSLLNAEREAQRRAPFEPGARADTETAAACEAALSDPAYPPCAADLQAGPSPCRALVDKVCGADDRCADRPACPPARQLLSQERNEQAESLNPNAITPSGAQCQEALGNDFFAPCP